MAHDFLWRIEKQVPGAGFIGVFNRSQYEDVLVARARELVPKDVWSQRYQAINDFEERLADRHVTVVKCFLHISTKYWKYNPGDVDEAYWDSYQQARFEALHRCSTAAAPWNVIPSDRKWYRNWAVAALLAQTLEAIDPAYPPPAFDVEVEKSRVAAS